MISPQPIIVLAGASGDLGTRIARALVSRGAAVRALIRPNLSAPERIHLTALGVSLAETDPEDVASLAAAMAGASCVVSALNGLHDVILDRQSLLLDAAVSAGVPRFIPSDYSEDFTHTAPGDNRNLDLRREFMGRADRASIQITSILNGAFMDVLGAEMPIIQPKIRRVLYWISADQPMDFTTKDDVAAYVAAAALDGSTPRFLRIAGETISARELAGVMSEVTGELYRPLYVGGKGMLGLMIRVAKRAAPQPGDPFPAWQGMQYMRDMFTGKGKLTPLDNDRYRDLRWTSVREQLSKHRPS
ncbi:NmrA family protein [Deinococcus sp. Arct2-2]|uniref:NmrA family NAD(P)-binding protein n=1 Tax=Deinococcus sp. Arct2-2 TaxID=2568653 RepID=UPI0010A42D1A|nr:NmrA family NAD(P)-binding protein [Deinococcus sp. Arct2-2]THF68383.1 NmrA family protein [Deinococcus sp. Arct2-2]